MDQIETYTHRVRRIRPGGEDREVLAFPLEVPVALHVNASLLASLSASPTDLDDLAVGFLFLERLVSGLADIASVSVSADRRRGEIRVETAHPLDASGASRFTSSCSRGITFLGVSDLDDIEPLPKGRPIGTDDIREALESMRRAAEDHRRTGAVHAAALITAGGRAFVAEDIGRHNAADKAVGACLRSGQTPENGLLVASGRVSSDLALKAAVARCPVVVSMHGATHLGAEVCQALGVTMVIHARGETMDVCTHPERIS